MFIIRNLGSKSLPMNSYVVELKQSGKLFSDIRLKYAKQFLTEDDALNYLNKIKAIFAHDEFIITSL